MDQAVFSVASSSMTDAFSTVASNMTSGINELAPLAIGVAGVVLLWRFGTKFFKSVAK